MRARHGFIVILFLALASLAQAQSPTTTTAPQGQPPAAAAPAPAAANPAAAPKPAAPAPEPYIYKADGRRDPFLNLIGGGTEKGLPSRKGEGPTGMSVGEISVRGVMESRGSLVAMIQGPDNK